MATGGALSTEITLKALPSNARFTVTELVKEERGKWFGYIDTGKKVPYDVSPGSLIGTAKLSTTNVLDRGPGVSTTVKFKVTCPISEGSIEKTGYIKASSTDWPLFGRPDTSILIFGFDGDIPSNISRTVPFLLNPDPYYVGIGVEGSKIALVASTDDSLSTTVISNILSGIVTAHTKALSWVFGKIF